MKRRTPEGAAAPTIPVWAKLISNSNWNFAAFAIAVLANFLTLPIVVHRIGIGQFGESGLVIAILAPLMLVGTVIGQACVRHIAPMLAEHRLDEARKVFASALALCLAGCSLVFLVLGVGGSLMLSRFVDGGSAETRDLRLICIVATAGWAAQQFFTIFLAVIAATQRYRLLALLNIASALCSMACLLLLTWLLPTALGFLLGTALGFFVTLTLSVAQTRRSASKLFPLARPDRASLGLVLSFGRWQAPAQLAGALAQQADRYLLGSTAALAIVGQLNVATRLQEVVYMGVLKISEVLFPHFSASASRPLTEQAPVYFASTWLINALAAAALAPLIPLGDALVTLWVGPDAAGAAGPILRTLATAGIVGSGMNVFQHFALGHGHTRLIAHMTLVHCVIVLVSSAALILTLGPLAAGAGFLVANVIRLLWATSATPRLTGAAMTLGGVAWTTLPPLAAGLLVGWAPWPTPAGRIASWPLFVLAYIGLAVFALAVSAGISMLDARPRLLIMRMSSGARAHFSKR